MIIVIWRVGCLNVVGSLDPQLQYAAIYDLNDIKI